MSATWPRDRREVIREEPSARGRLLEALAGGPLTVPELAAACNFPEDEVMTWIMGMRKYGYVVERGPADDGYYRFEAVAGR